MLSTSKAKCSTQSRVAPWVPADRKLIELARARGEVNANAHIDTVSQIIPSLAAFRAP